jgi:predicted DNA-binding transcriptional regulator YafY
VKPPVARFAERIASLSSALTILELHPAGLPLAQLASELDITTESLRQTLLAYYVADVAEQADFALPVIEFVGGDEDPGQAEVVRVVSPDPERELGVEHLTAEQLGALHAAGSDLLALEPDNEVLLSAMAAFESSMWPVPAADAGGAGAEIAAAMNRAAQERRRVHIGYARAWQPGTSERVVEPYRVLRTRRGWEVDAGPVDDAGRIRTYLVSGIQLIAADKETPSGPGTRDETFDRPSNVDQLIAEQRTAVDVELVVPQTGRWAVERFAESVTLLQDDEESVKVRAAFLPPVEQRVGLVLISCGPDAFVTTPPALVDAGVILARQLLDHHTSR